MQRKPFFPNTKTVEISFIRWVFNSSLFTAEYTSLKNLKLLATEAKKIASYW